MTLPPVRAPVRSVDRYLATTFLTYFIGVVGVLTAALQLLDLVGRSEDILRGADGDWAAIARYVRLRAPAIAIQFAAPAALIAAMAAFAALNRSGELIILRSVGMSPGRMLRPLIQMGALLAVVHFVAHDQVVAPDRATLQAWEARGFTGEDPTAPTSEEEPIWVAVRDAYIKAGAIRATDDAFHIDDVTVYLRDEAGQLAARLRARTAEYANGAWLLKGVDRFDSETQMVERAEEFTLATAASPAQFLNAVTDPATLSIAGLVRIITQLERQRDAAVGLRTDLLHRIAASAALALMPYLGAIVAFGAPRRNPLFLRAAAGMALGFVYFVTENVMVALGRAGATAPALAAFTPLIGFAVIGAVVLLYGDEHIAPARKRNRRMFAGTA